MKTQKIKLTELKSLVKNILKEEQTKKKKVIKESWEGVDADLETSLFEYGFVAKNKSGDEYFVLYDAGNGKYDTGHIRETELNDIVLGKEWAKEKDILQFLSFVGSDLEDWLQTSFVNKLSDLISYWEVENIMGSSYGGFSKEEAEKMLMDESYKPKSKTIKLSEVRQLVRKMIMEENSKISPELNNKITKLAQEKYKKNNGKTKVDFDKFYDETIKEFGYDPKYFKEYMEKYFTPFDDDDIY
jgi:ribosomal protein L31E